MIYSKGKKYLAVLMVWVMLASIMPSVFSPTANVYAAEPAHEAEYSTDEGASWTSSSFSAAVTALNGSTGGIIRLLSDVTLNTRVDIIKNTTIISGGGARTIKPATNLTGYMLAIGSAATLTLGSVNGMGEGNTLTIDGGAVWTGAEDSTLKRGTSNEGIYTDKTLVWNYGTFNMYDGVILQNNQSNSNGAAVRLGLLEASTNAIFNMYGGEIKNTSSRVDGGGVLSNSGTTFTMSGTARITGVNSDTAGGAVCARGSVIINGGTISGNKAGFGAVAIYSEGTLTINGGEITGNKSNNDGAGIFIYNSAGALKIQGNPVIKDNIKGTSTASNIYITAPRIIQAEGTLTGAAGTIGITGSTGNGMTVVTGYDANQGDNTLPAPFFSDVSTLKLISNGSGGLKLDLAPTPETTPTAAFQASTMTLSNVSNGMKYSVDGGSNWINITAMSVVISNVTTAYGIKVYKAGNNTTTSDSAIQTITVTQAATPTSADFTVTQPSSIGGTGSIAGILSTMAYSLNNGTTWTSGGNVITGIPGGTTYLVRTKGTGTLLDSDDYSITINQFSAIAEATPSSSIHFETEKLSGLVGSASYKINGSNISSNANGEIPIDSQWFGTNISIIKPGNTTTTSDSTAQSLDIPARPTMPSPTPAGVNETILAAGDGKITNVTDAMEFSLDNTAWRDVTADEAANGISGLGAGIYYVRIKATSGSFSSIVTTLTIGMDNIPVEKDITIDTIAPVRDAAIADGTNTAPAGTTGPTVTWSSDDGANYASASGTFAAGTTYKTKYVYTANTDYVFDSTIAQNDITVTHIGDGTIAVQLTDDNKTLTITVTWPSIAMIPLSWSDSISAITNTWDNGGTITTAEGLAQFAYNVNNGKNYSGQTITLSNDINLSGKEWTPIGSGRYYSFRGTFDGNGHKIMGLQVGSEYDPNITLIHIGLFGYLNSGTIKNVGVDTAIYSEKSGSGHMNWEDDFITIGGLVGTNQSGNINHCYATGNITTLGTAHVFAGGLVGWNDKSAAILNSYATVDVTQVGTSTDNINVGGLVGLSSGDENDNDNASIINNYATGNVTAGDQSGTFVGVHVGGLVGRTYKTTIRNSYATGSVNGGKDSIALGGLVGSIMFTDIAMSYWNNAASTKAIGEGPVVETVGMESEDMKDTAFVTTLNNNLETLKNPDLKQWQAKSEDYPIFSNTLWSATPETAYSVIFTGGAEATGTAPTQEATAENATFVLPANTFTRNGYTFIGWNDGTNMYIAGITYTMPANAVTFTAQWTANVPDTVPGFNLDGPGGKPTPKPGENPGETKIVGEDGNGLTPAGDNRFIIKVSSSTIATPKIGDLAPTGEGVTVPYTLDSPISGVDSVNNKYIGFYEVDSDNKVVRFELIVLEAGDVNPPVYTDITDAQAVAAAKISVEAANYTNINEGIASDQEAIKEAIKKVAEEAISGNLEVVVTVNDISFTPASESTNGKYVFTVTINIGEESQTTTQIMATIIPTYEVSGEVKDSANNNASDAVVTLMRGQTQIGSTVNTNAQGAFTIIGIPNGTYNLVVSKNGIIVTTLITVSGGDYLSGTITLPNGKTNSIVEVKTADTPPIVVGGLDTQFTATEAAEANKGITAADKTLVSSGGEVEIKFTAEKKAENSAPNANSIKTTASNNGKTVGIFIDLSVIKTVIPPAGGGDATSIPLVEIINLIEVLIPLDEALQNKDGYFVYRYHNTGVDTITTEANADGEKIELVDNGKTIKLSVKKFSTFAIAYTSPVEPPPVVTPPMSNIKEEPSNNVTIKNTNGGTIKESQSSTNTHKDFIITANEGYAIADILVDGKSVGAAKEYTLKDLTKKVEIQAIFVKATDIPYYIDRTGKEIFIKYSKVIDGVMKYIAPQGVTVLFKDNTKYFNDINGHLAMQEIDFVSSRELFIGTGLNEFSPNIPMTRSMFVTLIGRLHEVSFGEIPESTDTPFADILHNSWYSKYIKWARENGIIRGVDGGKFEPDRAITREEIAVVIDNYLKFAKFAIPVNQQYIAFEDEENIGEWAKASVQSMQKLGIIEATEDYTFNPKGISTRAQAATIIYRMISIVLN